jgi:outer membrane immunogenic protein
VPPVWTHRISRDFASGWTIGLLGAHGFDALKQPKINWDLTARARVGYAYDNWLLYATGGAETDLTGAFGVNPCVTISVINGTPGLLTCSGTNKRVGATAGAGVEYGFTPNLNAKIEYRYIAAASLELSHINEVLAGVNYRFGGP